MIVIKGNAAGSVSFWGKHLMRDDTNDRAELIETSGLLAESVPEALREMQAIAKQSRCHGDFMYSANINPEPGETLTPEQWQRAVDILEKNMKLKGHQRIVVEHEKEGRTHRHVVWNRVDVDTLKVTDIKGNWYTHERTSRELEETFGLAPMPSLHGQRRPEGRPERGPELWELRAAERSGFQPEALKAEFTALWKATDSGQAFAAALDDKGFILAMGDRRSFVAVDPAGTVHSLARRLDGVNTKQVNERLADLDREALPTVAKAKETQKLRAPVALELPKAAPELGKTESEIRLAARLTGSADAFASALEDRGLTLAVFNEADAKTSQRTAAFARELGNRATSYTAGEVVIVNQFGGIYRLNERTTGQTPEDIEKFLATLDGRTLMRPADASDALREASNERFIEEKQTARPFTKMEARIDNAQGWAVSGGAFVADLYRQGITIARVDEAGISKLIEDERFAFVERRLMIIPNLKVGELVALNSTGNVYTLNPFKMDMAGIELALTAGNRSIPALSDARENIAEGRAADDAAYEVRSDEFWKEVLEKRAIRYADKQESWSMGREAEVARVTDRALSTGPEQIAEQTAFKILGVAESLGDFASSLLAGGSKEPPKPASQVQQIKEQRQAYAALERIYDTIDRGEALQPSDIQSLTPTHLDNLRRDGDGYMRKLVEAMEYERAREREREDEYGRARER
jgi:hypothetical protein